jgi:hypothetical protein
MWINMLAEIRQVFFWQKWILFLVAAYGVLRKKKSNLSLR